MIPIDVDAVQAALLDFEDRDVFLHLETTTGSYAALRTPGAVPVVAYVRNGAVRFTRALVRGTGPSYRVGLKLENGWVYAEGLTDYEVHGSERLLLAGHDADGQLTIALQVSASPFEV